MGTQHTFVAVAALAGIALLATIGAGRLLSRPARAVVGPTPSNAEPVTLTSSLGARLSGWFFPSTPGKGALLLLHGVRADRRAMLARANFLHAAGYAVLVIDLQAHGESTGERISFGNRESADAQAAVEFLRRRCAGSPVAVIGVSLGAAAAVLATPRLQVDAYVLESMFPSIAQAIGNRMHTVLGPLGPHLSWLLLLQLKPTLGISPDALKPIDRVPDLGRPLLFVQGTEDPHTTLAEARALFAEAKDPKALWEIEGAAHEDLHAFAGAEYQRRILDFLSASLIPSPHH